VPIEDVWFDEAEIRQRKPRSMFHVQNVDKFVLLEQFAKDDDYPGAYGSKEDRERAILKAATSPASWRSVKSTNSQHRVDVYEAWHLPSGEVCEEEETDEATGETRKVAKHDGRHVIAIDGCTLVDEPWEEETFPIFLYVPRKRRRSILGLSLMFNLVGPQREYEKLTKKIQHQHQKMGVSGFGAPKSANLNTREITSGTFAGGFFVEWDGQQGATPIVVEPVAAGTYQYAESIAQNMLESNGISGLAASSQLPAGLQQASGKALQVFEDFESERLLPYHRERERWKMAVSKAVVRTACRIADREGSYRTRYKGKRGWEELDWKELVNDMDEFILRVFPVSQLSKQPAAKFAQLTELLNAQAITVEQFKRLYELPDLEAENELDTADTDVIDRAMDIMVTTGRYLPPEPFFNLDLIVARCTKFYELCRQQEVPEDRLQLLRDYIADAKSLMDQAAGPPPPPMGPPLPGEPPMPDPAMGMDPAMNMPPPPMAA
jgi:hypothetical protein